MYKINEDLSIYVTRGDIVLMDVKAEDNGIPYTFMPGDLVRIKVYKKKKATDVVLEKDFPITAATQKVQIYLSEDDTKIGEVISKPVDYWYEVELNPDSEPQTIIGYDEDGAKIFKLFPEGADKEVQEYEPGEEELLSRYMDDELDLGSTHPVENQVIARAIARLEASHKETHKAVAELHVTPQMMGAVADGETEIGYILQSYLDSDDVSAARIYFPPGQYKWDVTVETDKPITLYGQRGQSVIVNDGEVACLKANGECIIEGLTFKTTNANREEFTVYAVGGSECLCYDTKFECTARSLNGLHIEGVVFSHIDKCVFNHSQISLKTWDCKITNTWVWALWRPYGIGIHGGSGNINLSNVDVVPPFRTENGVERTDIKAGIWVNSEGGNATNNIIMENVYLDGNIELDTGVGILCENVFCVTVSSFRANCMTKCPVIIDGCYDVLVTKGMFYKNNKSGIGSNEILVRYTKGNKHGNITIADNHFVNHQTDIATSAPAIKVENGAGTNVVIARNVIDQHSSLRAYGKVAIQTPTMSDLSSNIVTGDQYKARGSFVIKAGSSGTTVMLPSDMAKQPTQEHFRFWVLNAMMPNLRVQEIAVNSVWVAIDAAPSSDVTVYYEVCI